uniref:Uncharacterized protein MANES_14G120300 n=1 Tax=Rhizophora mucronata TaxID=61149 RepID=A0A2P2MVW8_RHIMU
MTPLLHLSVNCCQFQQMFEHLQHALGLHMDYINKCLNNILCHFEQVPMVFGAYI